MAELGDGLRFLCAGVRREISSSAARTLRASKGAGHSSTRFLLYIDFNSVLEIVLWIEYN